MEEGRIRPNCAVAAKKNGDIHPSPWQALTDAVALGFGGLS